MAKNDPPPPINPDLVPPTQPPTPPVIPQPSVERFDRNMSGMKKITIDRFRSDIQEVKKNRAWHKDNYDPENVPHRHFFDSHGRKGQEETYLTPMAGHTHKFKYTIKDGKLSAFECGPALVQKTSNKGDGTSKTEYVPNVLWINQEDPSDRRDDTHTHVMTYIKSEMAEVKA